MQTFLPYKSFRKSAKCLDYRRLGKQRIEAKMILQILLKETETKAWNNHPAVKMWRGYEKALAEYGAEICAEWIRRGYKDSLIDYFINRAQPMDKIVYPPWLNSKNFHRAHRSNLLRKDKTFYSKYKWDVPDNLPYVWPITLITKHME